MTQIKPDAGTAACQTGADGFASTQAERDRAGGDATGRGPRLFAMPPAGALLGSVSPD